MIKVLVVDDDKLARKGIISLIHEGQYNMQVIGDVQNGRAALNFLEKEKADLVFADIDMPEITGLELMQICKEKYPDMQFVVLTFYEEFQYVQQALRLGAIDYISKFRMESENCEELLNRIRVTLERRIKNSKKITVRPVPEAKKEDLTEEQWKNLVRGWKQMHWVYDEDNYHRLLENIKGQLIPLRKLEHLIISLIQTIEVEMGRESTFIPIFEEVTEAFTWLDEWRRELFDWACEQESLDKMPICILKVIDYIRNNINLSLHTEMVGGLVGMSRSYFSVNFKKLTGRTYHDFVQKERMKCAKRLLKNTDKEIGAIAAEVGYEDVNYFNRIFAEEERCTPSGFRKKCYEISEHNSKQLSNL